MGMVTRVRKRSFGTLTLEWFERPVLLMLP
jgi:hypothetical protein